MQSRVNNEPFGSGTQPPPPFPEPGYDPTHVGEAHYLSCDEYTVVPPETTNDSIRLGDVESTPGSEVLIPVFLTNERPIEAVQLVVRYDPNVLKILSGQKTISYDGTFYEQFVGGTFTYTDEHQVSTFTYGGPSVSQVDVHADDGIFTACIVGHLFFNGLFEIPPGQETIVAKIRATISGDVPPGTVLHIDPVNGPNDDGYGRFHLHNELTYKGEGRYATILPRQVGGILRIGVDGDISFFIRGDANDDKRVDVSDAISILDFLFLSKAELPCQDAADADDSGEIEITDAVVILSHLFLSTKAISPPYPEAGPDPNPDFLKRCRS